VRRVGAEREAMLGFVEVRFSTVEAAKMGELVLQTSLLAAQLPYVPVRNVKGSCIRHRDISKGNILGYLCRCWGIANHQVLAMGDSCNDVSLVDGSKGFVAAVPANADPDLKKLASAKGGYIATLAYGAAVAEALKVLVFKHTDQTFSLEVG